jgi:hypothetical protein
MYSHDTAGTGKVARTRKTVTIQIVAFCPQLMREPVCEKRDDRLNTRRNNAKCSAFSLRRTNGMLTEMQKASTNITGRRIGRSIDPTTHMKPRYVIKTGSPTVSKIASVANDASDLLSSRACKSADSRETNTAPPGKSVKSG